MSCAVSWLGPLTSCRPRRSPSNSRALTGPPDMQLIAPAKHMLHLFTTDLSVLTHFLHVFQTTPSQLSDRRSARPFDPPRTRATPLLSPSAIMTPPATCLSTPSLSHLSPSMRRRSASSPWTHTDRLHQQAPAEPGQGPATLSTTAPPTGCCPTATARPLYTPVARGRPAWSTLSPSPVTL